MKKKQVKKSKFETWFKEQFGTLPMNPLELSKLKEDHRNLEIDMRLIDIKLNHARDIQEKYTAALYAYNAFGKK